MCKLTNSIASAERKNYRLDRESNGEEVLGARVGLLEIDSLGAATVREIGGQLEVDS